jgi:hypothetical protein
MNREDVTRKIKALLAKTAENGATEAEAMAALARAQAMMLAHEITDEELNLSKVEKAVLEREEDKLDPHGIKWRLAYGISQFCNCEVWRKSKRAGGGLEFCGLRSDVDFAKYLIDHLASFVFDKLTDHLIVSLAPPKEQRRIAREFVHGLTDRLGERMTELSKPPPTQSSNSRALVVVRDEAIKAKMKECGINVRKVRIGSCGQDGSHYAAGHEAGAKASFGRPVSGRGAAPRIGAGS